MTTGLRPRRAVSVAFVLWGAMAAYAVASTPLERCTTRKTVAAAKNLAAQLACHAEAAADATPVEPSCLGAAETRLSEAFQRAGGCPGDADAVLPLLDACVDAVVAALPGTGQCSARKRKVAGRTAGAWVRCTARADSAEELDACRGKGNGSVAIIV